MTVKELRDLLAFLERLYVGVSEQDRFFKVLDAVKRELKHKEKPK